MNVLDWIFGPDRDEQIRRESLERLVNAPRRSYHDVPPKEKSSIERRRDWEHHLGQQRQPVQTTVIRRAA